MNTVFIGLFEFFIVLPLALGALALILSGIGRAILWIGGLRR
jgi:hypothetical protein